MNYSQNSTSAVPEHCLYRSYLSYHNKPTVICIYVKLPTKQEHILFIFGLLPNTQHRNCLPTCHSSSNFITSHLFCLLLGMALPSPWPVGRLLFILRSPTPKSPPLLNSVFSRLGLTLESFIPIPLLLSWKSCAAKARLLSVLPSRLGILKEVSLGILPLHPQCSWPGSMRALVHASQGN